ncbi:coiled-coil domain-containing protein 148 [Caerostris extrusa]|uniref:Coiled-coil domain-containing protein 148 n=1 Tax=Caerostris extrusa TaxID=172846 RepID=A0AAV4RIE4_CAEEX|nr:coiled-coil domain-containing protein 148 [Caerostris extrusa]
MKEEKSEVMAEVALTRGVEVLPSINTAAGSPTKTVDPTKGSPKKRKMLRFTGVPRTRVDVSPTRALKPLHNDRINGLAAAKKSTNRILERADHFKSRKRKHSFHENVVDPLWYIREDLKEWVRQHEGLRPLSDAAKVQHYQIKREVKELWAGYKEIAEDLLKEQRELEQQVKKRV